MTDRQKFTLAEKIARLQEYAKALRSLQRIIDRKRFFAEQTLQKAVERYLQLAIEAVLDISDQIINEQKLPKPKEYKETILILGEAKILPKAFAFRFASAAGFRNVLVHDYLKLDPKKVFEHFKRDVGDIEVYTKHVIKFLKRR